MLKRLLFVYAFLFSYSGAILHSIIPHHHHESHQEAKSHHHHDQSGHSHHDDQKDSSEQDHSGSIYFLTHAANSDITISHSPDQGQAQGKKAAKSIAFNSPLELSHQVTAPPIFHPPTDDPIADHSFYRFRALRAPPVAIC